MDTRLQFTRLISWQKAHELTLQIYKLCRTFPKYEEYALSDQMRRCSHSIASNISEGYVQTGKLNKARYYAIARGSLTELQNHLLLSQEVGYIDPKTCELLLSQTIDIHKLINSTLQTIKSWT